MPASLTFPEGALFGFLAVLARMGGAISFVPLPGLKAVPAPARAFFAVVLSAALLPRWPAIDPLAVTPGRLVALLLGEAVIGIALGLATAVVLEVFGMACQILGMQAGYGYASMIDPGTEADSGVLVVMAQLAAGMMFLAAGLDREMLRLFARSLETLPPGGYGLGPSAADAMIGLTSTLISAGIRLAMPVVALLVMLDVALALLSRLNQQLQLLSLAFPIKMLTALLALSWVASLFPAMLAETSGAAFGAARRILGI